MKHCEILNQILDQATNNTACHSVIDSKGQMWWYVDCDSNRNCRFMHQQAALKRLAEACYLISALYADYITDTINIKIGQMVDDWADKFNDANVIQPHWSLAARDIYKFLALHWVYSTTGNDLSESRFDWEGDTSPLNYPQLN